MTDAEAALLKRIDDNPADAEAWGELARTAMRARDWSLALDRWRRLDGIRGGADARSGIVRCHLALGRTLDAASTLLSTLPTLAPRERKGVTELTVQVLGALETTGRHAVADVVARVAIAVGVRLGVSPRGRVDVARERLRTLIWTVRRAPDATMAAAELIEALARAGKRRAAQRLAASLSERFPEDARVALSTARLATWLHDFEAAEILTERGRAGRALSYEQAVTVCTARVLRGDFESAVEIVEEACLRQGTSKDAALQDWTDLSATRHEDFAFPAWLTMLPDPSSRPSFERLHALRSEPREQSRFVAEHASTFEKSVRVDRMVATIHHQRCQAHRAIGEPVEALRALRSAASLGSWNPMVHHEYAEQYRRVHPALRLRGTRLVLMILSCMPRLARAEELAAQISSSTRLNVHIVVGNPQLSAAEHRDGLLSLPCDDGYGALARKVTLAYEYFGLATQCRGLLKLDEDVVVDDAPLLESAMEKLAASDVDYAGEILPHFDRTYSVPDPTLGLPAQRALSYCDGGRGYYLSKRSLRIITELCARTPAYLDAATYQEDAMIAGILADRQISPTRLPADLLNVLVSNRDAPAAWVHFRKALEEGR